MVNLYVELKERHQKEVNNFPMAFAFSDKQFKEGMESLGLQAHETDKVVSIGAGGFIRKSDRDAYINLYTRLKEEMQAAIAASDEFIFDMFNYELGNHEYTYTYEIDDTLDALGLTMADVEADERLLNGLQKACEYQRQTVEY